MTKQAAARVVAVDMSEPDDGELEEQLEHSACAGEHSALQGVVGMLKARAGTLFAAGRDNEAVEVRQLANEVEGQRREASKRLDEHIKRSVERSKAQRRDGR